MRTEEDIEMDEQEHRQEMELMLLQFRIRIATMIIFSVLMLAALALCYDAVAQARNLPYHGLPEWFVEIIGLAIKAGLVVFSIGAITIAGGRKKPKEIGDKGEARIPPRKSEPL